MNIHAALVICFVAFAGTAVAGDLTGKFVPPYPEGWKDKGGACIADGLGPGKSCDYSIGIVEKNSQLILILGKSAPKINPKKARWLVTDQMPYPKTPQDFHVDFGHCEVNGQLDATIIAIVKTTNTEWYTTVRTAFRANLTTERFEAVPIMGIRCINAGWGE